jgi:predicted MPP superfamily phosphohydrolase
MKTYLTKKNTFYFIQFCILIFGVAFPFWQTAEVFEIYHPLWIIIPGSVFIILFVLAFGTLFDMKPNTNKIFKKIVVYWLGGGFILFFTLLLFSGINTFLNYPVTYVVAISLSLASIIIGRAYHHGYTIQTKVISLSSSKITKEYSFIHLSDIHIGSNTKHDLERIIKKLEYLVYDFVVITGDLVDEDYAHYDDLAPLSSIKMPIYYITGNHEYYLRHKNFADFITKTDIHDVNDTKVSFKEIDIYGIDEKSSVQKVLSDITVDQRRYALGLMHEPEKSEMLEAEKQGIDLMLSGHTHNGQIFPFTLMVKMRYKFIKGIYELGSMIIYVSQGTGTWGPKMRLGTRNEITLISLHPEEK